MDLTQEKLELKVDFKNSSKLINERIQKSLFLLLYLPWMLNVIASISSTSRGYILVFFPKHVEDTVLGFIFTPISDKIAYVALIALCNFLVDLILFSIYMIQKNKFEIHKKKTVVFLLIGHLIGAILCFIGSVNQDVQAVVYSLTGILIFFGSYYVIIRFLPKKYFEILSPYSVIFLSQEVRKLLEKRDKFQSIRIFRASKHRLRLYVSSLLSLLIKNNKEKDLIVLVRKWKAIDDQDGIGIFGALNEFSNYLYSAFAIQIRGSDSAIKKSEKFSFLMSAISMLDNLLSWTIYSSTIFPDVLDLLEKSLFPVSTKKREIVQDYGNKGIAKIIKYHLSRASEADLISVKQKVYALIIIAFVYLISPTLIYIISAKDSSSLFQGYRFAFLIIQYLSIFFITYLSVNSIQKKFRRAGVDIFVSHRFFGYLINSIVFLLLLIPAVIDDQILYGYLSQFFFQNLYLFIVGTIILQALLLFVIIKPPVELRKSSIATSLLVRELLLLRAQVLDQQGIRGRRQLSRYVYFVKKYFNYIVKDLINSRFDSSIQKTQLRGYFSSINEHLDSLSSNVKLGAVQNRETAVAQIDTLIYYASIEEFGEIPNMIPEIKTHLELKSVQPKAPSFIRRVFQILDTSWLLRFLTLVVLALIINLLNPSLWEYLQNLSSLFGILPP